MRKLKRKGFTIVELVIVVAVIAILAAVLIPTFVHLSKKANKSVDQSLVSNLNTALAMEEADSGKKPKTMQDAVDGLKNQGYLVAQFVTKSGEDLVYSLEENRFHLSTDIDQANAHKYWHIESSVPTEQKYSIYAYNWGGSSASNLTVGFDSGEEEGIKEVSFVGGHDAIIRTNSLETNLSINAPENHVTRYGTAAVVEPLITAVNSFEDHGSSAWVTLKGGRFVVTRETKVDKLYLDVDKNDESQALAITINSGAEMPEIVRPALDLAENETVKIVEVTTSASTETLYLRGSATIEGGDVFSSPDGGTTMSVVNTDTASATAIAIANAKVAGEVVEKGLTEEEKTEAVVDAKTAAEIAEMQEETGADLSMYEARIGYTGYATFKAALDAAKEGETISLMKDISLTDAGLYSSNRLWVLKNITIDGCNFSATTIKNGFGICTEKVTFKNITIKTASTGYRCIDVRTGQSGINKFVEEVTLDHVVLDTSASGTADSTQPLTIGGNATSFKDSNGKVRKTKINVLNHSTIKINDNATAYYAIITFNPIELNLKDSSVKGWANLYFKGANSSYGSKGSVVNIDNCDLHSKNIYNGTSNAFAMIMFEDGTSSEKITVNIKNSKIHVDAYSDQYQGFVGRDTTKYFAINLLEGNSIYFNNSVNAVAFVNASNAEYYVANGNEVYSQLIDDTFFTYLLDDNTQVLRDDGNGKYTVVAA